MNLDIGSQNDPAPFPYGLPLSRARAFTSLFDGFLIFKILFLFLGNEDGIA